MVCQLCWIPNCSSPACARTSFAVPGLSLVPSTSDQRETQQPAVLRFAVLAYKLCSVFLFLSYSMHSNELCGYTIQ